MVKNKTKVVYVETNIPARELRVGDRVVFIEAEGNRKHSRELRHIGEDGDDFVLEFRSGRGIMRVTVTPDRVLTITTKGTTERRFVLA